MKVNSIDTRGVIQPHDREGRTPLRAHRETLARNRDAYTADLARVRETAVYHLKRSGFAKVTLSRCGPLVDRFVGAIFETQAWKPFFHVDGSLPYCWNAPKDWDYIRYEWGHLHSRNQNEGAHDVENLCLQSARCNQHVQTSMDIAEVVGWLEGSRVAARVRIVLDRRRRLFDSHVWKTLLEELSRFR
jgi:hypothetical protein